MAQIFGPKNATGIAQGISRGIATGKRAKALKEDKEKALFQVAMQIRAEERAVEDHAVKMRRSVPDYDAVKLGLEQKRQAIEANKVAVVKAQRDAVQSRITSAKALATQTIAHGKQAIKDVQDSTGNNTEYTKDQQADIKQARNLISAGNVQLAEALKNEMSFNNPKATPEELAKFSQTLYLGLDRQSANINVSPLNQSNQNEISRIDALVKPDRRAAWVQAQSSGSMATIRGFGADANNVFNPTEQANARTALTSLLSIGPQIRAEGDNDAKQIYMQSILSNLETITDGTALKAKNESGILGTALKITAPDPETTTDTDPASQATIAGRARRSKPTTQSVPEITGPPEPAPVNQAVDNSALKELLRSRLGR